MMCAALVAGSAAQVASAGVLFTNVVRNTQAYNIRPTLTAAGAVSATAFSPVNGAIRNQYVVGTGGATGKAWVQYDLTGTWALYGQTNLTSATMALWNQNGTGRAFWVAGIADSAGLESWAADLSLVTWSNAPANDYFNLATMGYAFDWSKIHGGTNLWQVPADGIGVDVAAGANTQGAVYFSTNAAAAAKVKAFLLSDTDGKVTCAISDGPANLNQTVPIGTNGTYGANNEFGVYTNNQPIAANGITSKDSPQLTMVFDVRVALTGGGNVCPGDPGVDVSMFGTDVGVDYLLYTNGVYSKTVSGTGSGVSFGLQNTTGSYTAVASNTTTFVTTPVPSTVTVSVPLAPSFTVQPTAFVGATNSIAAYSVTASGIGISYAWFRNGVALTDDGHYSGTTTEQLIINPVLATDAATSANGYYCRVANVCGAVAFSTTNALTIQVARNLVWQGTPTNAWNIGTTANWTNSAGVAVTFNQGDNVTLNDTAVNTGVVLASPILAPGTITFNHSAVMGIGGSGTIAGPASQLIVNGTTSTSQLNITNANTFGGGTIINDGWLVLRNNFAVGSGVINLAGTGFSLLEVVPTGQAGIGIPGVNVTANSILQFDGSGAFAGVVLGPINGTPGKTLTVQAPAAVAGSNLRFYGDFTCNNDIVMNINGANWASYQSGTTIYNGLLSGNAIMYPRGGNTELNGANTFTQTIISQGNIGVGIDSALPTSSPVGLGPIVQDNQGDNGIYAAGGARTIENPFTWLYRDNANRWFRILGTNQLTMSGQIDLSGGTNNVSRIFRIDNTAPSILSGVVTDSGQNCGITKTGTGTLYLNNGANSYTGGTTIGTGVLAGSGNIPGDLAVTNGAVGGGSAAAIGTLSVSGNVSFSGAGGAFIRVNRSGSQSDKVSVGGTLASSSTGTVTVTNLGAALQVGDSFVLFPGKTVTGGNTLSVTGAGVTWTNKLAVDGSIQVLSILPTVNTNPTNITFSVSGGTVNLSWPADHIGWSLQAQTNTLGVGLNTNWATLGFTTTNAASFPIIPGNPAVFYRLKY